MSLAGDYARELKQDAAAGWNRFWFSPADPATLGLIRILAGAMLLYTHLIWGLDLESFFGPRAWLSHRAVRSYEQSLAGPAEAAAPEEGQPSEELSAEPPSGYTSFAWSVFDFVDSRAVLWSVHIAALVTFALLMVGYRTRTVSILAFILLVSYVNRTPAALFGLDQINGMLAMYLMVGPSGAAWSVDRWLAERKAGRPLLVEPRVGANLAIRLIQLHMCVIYFFAAMGKLEGATWRDGSAIWFSFANLEYQSLDMTWMCRWPLSVNFMTHLTVYWELFFCVLIWPRLTRPLVLLLAVPLHLGIALCMGMMTFGLIMLVGCLAFVSPALVRIMVRRLSGLTHRNPAATLAPSPAAGKSRKPSGPRTAVSA